MNLKRTFLTLLFAFLLVLIICALTTETKADRTGISIDVTVHITLNNTNVQATALVGWTGGGIWDGAVNFTWYNTTGGKVFYEEVIPDGSGYAFSNYVVNEVGTWYLNGTWTTDNSVFDNQSFSVTAGNINKYNNVTWSENVNIEATFFRNTTWIGQNQGISLSFYNSSNETQKIIGVDVWISVITTEGETLLSTADIGKTSSTGEVFFSFTLPVDKGIENRFAEVVVSIQGLDYTSIFGWTGTSSFSFYIGYFIQFENESAHKVLNEPTGGFEVFDWVYMGINYTHNYTDSFESEIFYQIQNISNLEIMYSNTIKVHWDVNNLFPIMSFQILLGENVKPGLSRMFGFIKIFIPNTDEFIIHSRTSDNFIINNTKAITYYNTSFNVSPSMVDVGDEILLEISEKSFVYFDYYMEYVFKNIDKNYTYERLFYYNTANGGKTKETYTVILEIPNKLCSGNYTIIGYSVYDISDVRGSVFWNTTPFYVNSLIARASSTIDVFGNYTRLELDGSESEGYNDSYYGLRWTNTANVSKTYYGLNPIMVFENTGNFTITLNITDGNGNYSEDSFNIYSLSPPVDTYNNYHNETTNDYGPLPSTTLYTLTVITKDSDTNLAVQDYTVTIDGDTYSVTGSAQGKYTASFYGGTTIVTVNVPGYYPNTQSFNLNSDRTITFNMYEIVQPDVPEDSFVIQKWVLYSIVMIIGLIVIIISYGLFKSPNKHK